MNAVGEIFTRLTGELDYPMLVVTTRAHAQRAGCLVGFATQNRTLRIAERADALAVHFLPAAAIGLARLFGSETGDEHDKFTRCRWHDGPGGLPILDECGRWFAGRILERRKLGDHVGFLLGPFAAADDGHTDTLSLQRVNRLEPGHDA
jgi:flavin reductase (DIM6/NTAB) family NADH-FMN oxidoreductase RutF